MYTYTQCQETRKRIKSTVLAGRAGRRVGFMMELRDKNFILVSHCVSDMENAKSLIQAGVSRSRNKKY